MREDANTGARVGESFWNRNVATVEKQRTWWKPTTWSGRSPKVEGTSAWFASLVVHVGILVLLASITLYIPLRDKISLSIVTHNAAEEAIMPQTFNFSPDIHDKVGALSEHGLD